ncbi:hypothetical protein AHF37_10731 [Paragonimus kellicotti]|nr:hypothetical protein AHF37_10731 [Paragonimus kellicotti]
MPSECHVYYVLYRSSEMGDLVKQTFNSVGPHLIDGLRPQVVYAYHVQAYFGLIPGAVSFTVKEKTFPGERPATPYDFKLVPMIRCLKLLWKLPEGQSATVENYFIWLDDSAYLLENENKTEFVLVNLHPCQFYTVELVAVSAASIKSGKVIASGSPLSEILHQKTGWRHPFRISLLKSPNPMSAPDASKWLAIHRLWYPSHVTYSV